MSYKIAVGNFNDNLRAVQHYGKKSVILVSKINKHGTRVPTGFVPMEVKELSDTLYEIHQYTASLLKDIQRIYKQIPPRCR